MNQPSDQAARTRALNPGQSFIVQAPAGSGKTGLLVRRMLKLLCYVDKPEEILAITFTRKATQEMQTRVIEALHKAQTKVKFENHESDLEALALATLQQDKKQGWHLLENAQRLKIMTIDALCADLVRRMPLSARFGAMPQIEQDIGALYQQAALNCLSQLQRRGNAINADLTTLLVELEGNASRLQEGLADLLHSRDHWLPLLLHTRAQEKPIEFIESQWQQIVETQLNVADTLFLPSTQQALLTLANYAAGHIPDKHHSRPDSKILMAPIEDNLSKAEKHLLQWQKIAALLLTQDNKWRSQVNINLGFASDCEEKPQLKAILNQYQDDDSLLEQLTQLRRLPSPTFSSKQAAILNALLEVLPALASELFVLMTDQNLTDYAQLTTQAVHALGDNDAPSDLSLILDASLKHILMDEFQDTSPQQLGLIERLCAGWQPNDGKSLFFVGDPMQSIYGFRNADVRVFLQVQGQGINDIRPENLVLSDNFRSSSTLVDWVNQQFPSVLSPHNSPELGAVAYTPSTPFKTDEGQIQCHLVIDPNASVEGRVIAQQVLKIQQQDPKQTIAVLARKRGHLLSVAAHLREQGAAFESIELETLGDQACIQDLLALTKLLIHPQDVVAWLSVLRAPWCGLELVDLTHLRNSNEGKASLWEVSLDKLSAEGSQRYEFCAATLKQARQAGQQQNLSEQVRSAWLSLNGPACVAEHELTYCEAFFDLLQNLEQRSRHVSDQQLQQAVDNKKISSAPNSIKLLTLHKAKGLEFDTVFLAGLCGKAGGNSRSLKLLDWDHSSSLALLAPAAHPGQSNKRHNDWIKQLAKQREQHEAGRLLYVGATRAQRQLHLFGHLKNEKKKPERGSLMHLLWPQLSKQFLQNIHHASAGTLGDNTEAIILQPSLRRLPINLPKLALPIGIQAQKNIIAGSQIEYEWAQEQARIVGVVIHQALQQLGQQPFADWPGLISTADYALPLRQFGLVNTELDDALVLVHEYLQNTLDDPKAQWLFDVSHQQIEMEWALSGPLRGQISHRVIDRSFVDEMGTRWIVDFKTSPHKGVDVERFINEQQKRYQNQLHDYGTLVQALGSQNPIKLGLYFPALQAWREWSFKT